MLDALLGRGEKTGAEKGDHVRIDFVQAPKGFFAILKGIERSSRTRSNPCDCFRKRSRHSKPDWDRRHFKPGFGEDAVSQDPGCRLVVHDENAARPEASKASRSADRSGVVSSFIAHGIGRASARSRIR